MRMTASYTDDRGWTPLHIVARKGDLKQVRRLLNEGMDANVMVERPKSFGMTPLHLAAKGGHARVMDELLERGADIDAQAKGACAWTPFHHAAKEKKKKAIKFLISVIVAAEDVHRGKPDPEMFVYASQLLQFIPDRCIVFGNSKQIVEAAHDAQMKCVADC